MAYSKSTNIFKNVLFSRGMALAIIFLIVFVGYGLVSIAQKSIEASHARKSAEAQASSLKQKNDDMAQKLAEINTPDGREAALREQFPVVKPGEHVVVITDPDSQAATDVPIAPDTTSSGGFWNFLKNIFKKN